MQVFLFWIAALNLKRWAIEIWRYVINVTLWSQELARFLIYPAQFVLHAANNQVSEITFDAVAAGFCRVWPCLINKFYSKYVMWCINATRELKGLITCTMMYISVCEYYAHVECQDFVVSDCKECATYVPQKEKVSELATTKVLIFMLATCEYIM